MCVSRDVNALRLRSSSCLTLTQNSHLTVTCSHCIVVACTSLNLISSATIKTGHVSLKQKNDGHSNHTHRCTKFIVHSLLVYLSRLENQNIGKNHDCRPDELRWSG